MLTIGPYKKYIVCASAAPLSVTKRRKSPPLPYIGQRCEAKKQRCVTAEVAVAFTFHIQLTLTLTLTNTLTLILILTLILLDTLRLPSRLSLCKGTVLLLLGCGQYYEEWFGESDKENTAGACVQRIGKS